MEENEDGEGRIYSEDGHRFCGDEEETHFEDGKDNEGEKGSRARAITLADDDDDDEDEDDVKIVGKKRKALYNKYDPKKARSRKMLDYYGNGTPLIISK